MTLDPSPWPIADRADPAGCPPAGPADRVADIAIADLAATVAFAARLAARLAEPPAGAAADVVCLWGTLAAGKTALMRALIAAAAGAPVEVPSPTFTLVQTYDLPIGPLWHFDLYRLSAPEEVFELGWEEALTDGIVAVEWPNRLGRWMPGARLDLVLEIPAHGCDEADGDVGGPRRFRLIGRGPRAAALVDRLAWPEP